ncbi:MAG: isoamylase early set domain-containing protein [Saprospiraceae bacterium]
MITKQFMKAKPVCKATFTLPVELAPEAQNIQILGDFNNWDPSNGIEMKKQKNGFFKATVELESGKEYQFRYLVDGNIWINDQEADKYVPTQFGTENCVISALN